MSFGMKNSEVTVAQVPPGACPGVPGDLRLFNRRRQPEVGRSEKEKGHSKFGIHSRSSLVSRFSMIQ